MNSIDVFLSGHSIVLNEQQKAAQEAKLAAERAARAAKASKKPEEK